MVSLNWVTFLSILVSGTMLFTLAATVVIYAKYKLGQKPVLSMHQEVAVAGGPSMSIGEAIQVFSESKEHEVAEVVFAKKKVRFSRSTIESEAG